MVPIAYDPASPNDPDDSMEFRADRSDPVGWIVRVTIALYLTPVLALVCVIGVVSIVIERVIRAAGQLSPATSRMPEVRPLMLNRRSPESISPRYRKNRQRTRVGL